MSHQVPNYIPEDECCANCGTDLIWWNNNGKRYHIYWLRSDEYCCSRKCVKELSEPTFGIDFFLVKEA